jgi:hypothetical protein
MFEVTSVGELVWEYRSPLMWNTKDGYYISDTLGLDKNGVPLIGGPGGSTFKEANRVHRCYRYAPDFPGLAGKSLLSEGTITNPVTYTGWGFAPGGGGFGGGGAAGGGAGAGGGGY